MILGGGDGAATGRTRRWVLFTLIVSILALVGGLVLVLLLSQFYIVPHLQSEDFVQTQCYVRSIEILHIRREGRVSKFNSPNCTKPGKTVTPRPRPKNLDDFDFTLSGTTSHPPGFYPTKPSSIFTRNYDNRRTFPDRSSRRTRPSNIYRTNSWDPFDSSYHQPRVQEETYIAPPGHYVPPQPQIQQVHPGLPHALAQHATVPKYDDELEETEGFPGLPKALAQFAEPPTPYHHQSPPHDTKTSQSADQPRALARRRGRRQVERRASALAPAPGVHALVPAPANTPQAPSPSARPQQQASRDCSTGFVQAGMLCVHVSVLFRGLDGFVALGTLYADQKSLPRENHTSTLWPTKKCICDGCTITALSGNGSAVDEILVGETKIRQGIRTKCYYPMAGGGHLLMFRTSNAVALHAILWPTLVFVSGFVGLFFSCLIIQKQRQQRRKQQTRPPMAYV